jgi:hypothetical protein
MSSGREGKRSDVRGGGRRDRAIFFLLTRSFDYFQKRYFRESNYFSYNVIILLGLV